MRKYQNISRILSVLLVLAMVLSCVGMTAFTAATPCAESSCGGEYRSGICSKNGEHYEAAPEQGGVYQISNAGQLYWFAALVNSGANEYGAGDNGDVYNAVLTADIVINAELGEGAIAWTPIGLYTSATEYVRYSGTFDGAGHTISGLYYNNTTYTGRTVGLFGCLDANGTVKNLTLANSAISGATDVGGIVGHNYGKVLGCTQSGTVTGSGTTGGIVARNMDGGSVKDSQNTGKVTGATTGGIVGDNVDSAVVENCENTGDVSGTNSVGGIVGMNKGTVNISSNSANVTASGTHTGGVVGNHVGGTIYACGNTGNVTGGSDYVGGVAGVCSGANITESFNTGSVTGGQTSDAVGGVVGAIDGTNLAKSTVTSCYNTGKLTGRGWVGGIAGVSGYQKTPQPVEFKNSYNAGTVEGTTNAGAVVGDLNKGTVTGSYYLQGCAQNSVNGAMAATAQQFASGEITNKLNEAFDVWYQELDKDAYPVLLPRDTENPEPGNPGPEETKPQETKPEETKPEETKPEETKPEETKPEETKPEETKPQVPECPKDDSCILSQFDDIKVDDWYHDGIHFCVDQKIMNGMGEGKFAPNDNTTRAQLVTMLYRLAGEPSVEGKEEPFTDVTDTDWFYAPIVWAFDNKVVNGVSDTEFAPNASITREQVATILYRYLGEPEGTGKLEEFPDVADVSAYAVAPLTWAVGEKLITGIAQPDGTAWLAPTGNATRAQIATILMRHLTK